MVVMDAADRVVGILSERDVVRAVAEGRRRRPLQADIEFMTTEVVFADPSESVDALLSRMTDRRMRHLPVCKAERLVGIVSIGDLVKYKIAETEEEART